MRREQAGQGDIICKLLKRSSAETSLGQLCPVPPVADTDVLRFKVKSRERVESPGLGVTMDIVYLDLNGTVVEFISYDGASAGPVPEKEHLGYRMMALEVDDMSKTADYLDTKRVKIAWGPKVGPTETRAEICDPNGNRIELRQWF